MTATARRRLLAALVLGTLVVVVLDLAGSGIPGRARSVAAAGFGPIQRALAGADRGDGARLAEENVVLQARLAQAQARIAQDEATGRLLASTSASSGHPLPARVVGSGSTVSGARQVSIDVGQRDGVEPNVTVVDADGLVGRVVSVGAWSSDVRLLDGAEAAVAVRVGQTGILGSITGAPLTDAPVRRRGELTLSLVDGSAVSIGDRVTTLGSVGGRPYAPGILVGTVTALDPPSGRLAGTAVVTAAVDGSRLDVVAVLLTGTASPTSGTAKAAS